MTKRLFLFFGALLFVLPFTASAANTLPTDSSFNQANQKVCSRFEEDVLKLAALMEELRRRKGITETRVAFGGVDTPIKNADYWTTYAAEAVAYQRAQKFSSKGELKYSLESVKNKILRAKNEVRKALDE